jgi:hypothetical protein
MKRLLCSITLLFVTLARSASGTEVVNFEKDVLPVLQQHCMECHGEKKQKSGLRVDSRAALLQGGDFGAAIIPGDAKNSHLIEVITSTDEDVRMPPKGEPLSPVVVEALKNWIAQGAVWPGQMENVAAAKTTSDHWSFQPFRKEFANDSLDEFIRTKLTEKKLSPSPEADRRTLIRRVTLDLTGLPPTPDEVEAYANDQDARAYEKVVERLLNSPRYGERWAQHWLDVIRYADTRGYEYNSLRNNTWPFRDWVIEALNNNLPYDQFLFQQIAGDTVGVDPATGFLVTAPLPTPPEIGEEPDAIKAARFNALDEVVQNVGASMLGLTVGCARCHNHKFDPITARDYYKMVSVFSGLQYDSRPWRKGSDAEQLDRLQKVDQRIDAVRQELVPLTNSRESVAGRYTDHFAPVTAQWVRISVVATDTTSEGPAFDELEVWSAEQPGTLPLNLADAGRGAKATSSGAALQLGSKDEFLNDGKYGSASTWVADRRPPAWVQIELAQPELIDRVTWSRDRELASTNPAAHAIRLTSAWRIEVATKAGEWRSIAKAGLDDVALQRRRDLENELQKLLVSQATLRAGPVVFAGRFTPPQPINVLLRGDPQQPRDPVGPGGLDFLNGTELPAEAPETERRVKFAQWLTTTAAHLTARVAVNRVWHHHFGTGLVDTPSDFGHVGSQPTHPELLDWLADEFIQSGWNLKKLHTLIVTSATYRQSSTPVPHAIGLDAGSRLLWRFPPRRLDAEAIRDGMLAITGSLDLKMGGEGVNIYTRQGDFDQWKPQQNPGPESWRRMIYLTKIRGADDGMFKTFDLPDCGQVRAKRSDSTTPLQALNLLNGQFTIEQSKRLAERVQREAGDDLEQQINRAFTLILARQPSDRERKACLLSTQGEGLVVVCRALFNSNEFLFLP